MLALMAGTAACGGGDEAARAQAARAAQDSLRLDSLRRDSASRRDSILGRDSAFGPTFGVDSTGKVIRLPRRP